MQTTAMFSLVKVLKNAPKMTMGMLVMSLIILTSCTEEIFKVEASSATDMLHSNDFSSRLGHTLAWWEGSAINGQGQKLSCRVEQNYVGEDTITVEVLGLPVVMMGDPTVNADGSVTITFSDGQRVTLTEGINASGIDFSAKRGEIYATLEQSSEGEMVKIHFPNHWEMTAESLPSSVVKNAKGDEDIPFVYSHKAAAAPAPAPVEVIYRPRVEFIDVENGNRYYNLLLEKSSDGGQSWEVVTSWKDFIACAYGQWNPGIFGSLLVNSYEFSTNDHVVDKALDAETKSRDGYWRRVNVVNQEYFWDDIFSAPADAEGKTSRQIGGTQILKIWKAILTNPETGEEVVFDFTGLMTSTHSVDANGLYTREVSVILNDEVIETQTGSVQLEKAQ